MYKMHKPACNLAALPQCCAERLCLSGLLVNNSRGSAAGFIGWNLPDKKRRRSRKIAWRHRKGRAFPHSTAAKPPEFGRHFSSFDPASYTRACAIKVHESVLRNSFRQCVASRVRCDRPEYRLEYLAFAAGSALPGCALLPLIRPKLAVIGEHQPRFQRYTCDLPY